MVSLPPEMEGELLGVISEKLQRVLEERPAAPVMTFAK